MRPASPAVTAAFHAIERAEQAVFGRLLDTPHEFLVRNRVAWSGGSVASLQHRYLPDPVIRDLPAPDARTTSLARSSLVRLGKRPRIDNVRARSFLVDDGRMLSLKALAGAGRRTTGAGEPHGEQKVRRELQDLGVYPVPALLAVGTVGNVDYLLEPVIFGSMPSSPEQRFAAAVDVIERLVPAYDAAGVIDRPLSSALRPDFATAFQATLSEPWFPWPATADRSAFISKVANLVESDLSLPCSLGHGDLSMTNVIRDDQGAHWVVDWEQGRRLPVAFDIRKLLLTSQAPAAVQDRTADVLRPFDGRGVRRYRWNHQLALGVCNEIAVAPRQRAGSQRADRVPQFDAKLATRVSWALELLS